MTRAQAVAVALAALAAAVWLLIGAHRVPTEAPAVAAARARQGGDVELYRAVVARVRAGQNYYDAAGAELRARNYPLRPAFNWRQPTYAWLLARLPSPLIGNVLLGLIGLAVVVSSDRWIGARLSGPRAALAVSLMVVTMSSCLVPGFPLFQEAWAGLLIALSLCLFAFDRWPLAVAASLAALAFRELALLPCSLGLALALRRRRWLEVGAWLVGLGLWAAFMSWHFAQVESRLGPGDPSRGWLALGGAAFLVETAQWNPLLLALPGWGVALVLPVLLVGLAGWRADGAGRVALVVFGYLAVFVFVGNPFNDYWGSVYAPLLTFGFMAAPAGLRDLARALRAPPRRD